jgi:hypothetical protein
MFCKRSKNQLTKFFLVSFYIVISCTSLADSPPPGHSHQGPQFNVGPRSEAILLPGLAPIKFQTTDCSDEASQFIRQGIAQLHGFLNLESERSFRQAASLDKDCAMAYWGLSMSSAIWVEGYKRSFEFAKIAKQKLTERHTQSEKLYVDSILAFQNGAGGLGETVRVLESIFQKNPDDLEAKAFYIVLAWHKGLVPRGSQGLRYLDGLANEILAKQPLHPALHYIVHMWDSPTNYRNALAAADRIGFSQPGLAHMWHMASHIYRHAGLLFDSWWSQEAAARVDHAYMKTKRVFPTEIHNHAHNNEWLTTSLLHTGAVDRAKDMALNLLIQPKHPVFNRMDQYQHLQTGFDRSLDALEIGEYWSIANSLFQADVLNCNDARSRPGPWNRCKRLFALSQVMVGNLNSSLADDLILEHRQEILSLIQLKKGEDTERNFRRLSTLTHLNSGWGILRLLRYGLLAGDYDLAADVGARLVSDSSQSVPTLLTKALVFAKAGKVNDATRLLKSFSVVSQNTDHSSPLLRDIYDQLQKLGFDSTEYWGREFDGWREIHNKRPSLESLGSFLWIPFKMDNITWTENDQNFILNEDFDDKPVIAVFSLASCIHCDAQRALLEEQADVIKALGIELVVITNQPENIEAFKSAQAFDDFESIPLHGIFILNSSHEVVWKDVGANAFMDIDFVIEQAKRQTSSVARKMFHGNVR